MHGGRGTSTETVRAVLADNQNDVVLSVGALLALIVTQLSAGLWWVDAAAALALTSYIAARWAAQGRGQVEQIIGRVSGTSRVHLGYISGTSRLYLAGRWSRSSAAPPTRPSSRSCARYSRDAAEMQPRCSRDGSRDGSRDEVEMKSRCRRDRARDRPRRASLLPNLPPGARDRRDARPTIDDYS